MRKFFYSFFSIILFLGVVYFGAGFYLAHTILRIDHSCGVHEGSLPNTWNTKLDYKEIKDKKRIELRKNFEATKYNLQKCAITDQIGTASNCLGDNLETFRYILQNKLEVQRKFGHNGVST